MLHGPVSKRSYHGIIDKVKARPNGWSTSSLSLAGRITLIKSVLSAVPLFVMQSTRIPNGIVDEVERVCRNFLWGHTDSRSKMHLISWDIVTQPISRGSLRIRRLREFNNACLAKICWGIIERKDQLWA